jgi:hypothetical protein
MTMNTFRSLLAGVAICFSVLGAGIAKADTQTMAGPFLGFHNIGWEDTGLQITALQDVTLTGFTFQNYGASDTIYLTDSANAVVQSFAFTGGGFETSSAISVNWALDAGQTYHLLSADADNSKWTDASFPQSNGHIQVDGGFGSSGGPGSLQLSYWFHFNDLTTTTDLAQPIPEPETYAMMLAGLGLLGLARRRKIRQQ